MKNITTLLLFGLLVASAAERAVAALTVGVVNYGIGGPCWDDTLVVLNPPSASGTFTLPGLTGSGVINSAVAVAVDNPHGQQHYRYNYSLDLSGVQPAANHCIRLLIHFGTPHTCAYDVLVQSGPGVDVSSASKATYGDITFLFGSGCLVPSLTAAPFTLLSDVGPKTNIVTVIDDTTDPASGLTNEVRVNVTAVVPDIPPNWAYAPTPIPIPLFQGFINNCNAIPMLTNLNGRYDFALQLVDAASNGLPVGAISTQTVQVVNGLFNVPFPGEVAGMCDGSAHWLSLGVRPTGLPAVQFTPLTPALPLTPTPQALYAYSAGVVADLAPGQAVTSLNGMTDGVNLVAGSGISISSGGDRSIIIVALPGGPSDRNLKTDIEAVNPESVLSKLMAMPIESWRFTNELADIRHVGPMAQDFKTAFGLGHGDKMIGYLDASGVALAAIQGLNEKVEAQRVELNQKETEVTELKQQLGELKQAVNQLNQQFNRGDQ